MTLFSKLDHSGGAESSYKVVQVHGVTAGGGLRIQPWGAPEEREKGMFTHIPLRGSAQQRA